MSEAKELKAPLPSEGIWTVEDLAGYLGLPPTGVMQHLTEMGVKVLSFSSRYKHKLFRLEDLRAGE